MYYKDSLNEILSFITLRDVIHFAAISLSPTCPTQMPSIADVTEMIYELSPAEATERFNYDDTAVKYFSGDLADHSCLIEVIFRPIMYTIPCVYCCSSY